MGVLDNIQIPEADADKPAEINLTPGVGDEGVGESGEPAAPVVPVVEETKPDDKLAEPPAKEPETTPADPEKKTEPPVDPAPTEKPADPQPDPEKSDKPQNALPTPVETKPDERVAKLEGQVETLTKLQNQPKAETPIKSVRERMAEKVASGWKPADRIEEMEVYRQIEKDVDTEIKAVEEKRVQEVTQRIQTVRDQTLESLQVKDEKDVVAVESFVLEQRNKGLWKITETNLADALKLAHEHLTATGKIGTAKTPDLPLPPVTTPTPATPPADPAKPKKIETAESKAAEEARKKAAAKIVPGSDGSGTKARQKVSYDQAHREGLDGVTERLKSELESGSAG